MTVLCGDSKAKGNVKKKKGFQYHLFLTFSLWFECRPRAVSFLVMQFADSSFLNNF